MKHDREEDEPKVKINATGTAKSIVAFGVSRKLDSQQQKAFEVLTATVVSSFVKDTLFEAKRSKDKDVIANLQKCLFQLKKLCKHKGFRKKPLRMFLTGPAGAGKCECVSMLFLIHLWFSDEL